MIIAGLLLLINLALGLSAKPSMSATVVVTVNGTTITSGDVEFAAMQHGVTPDQRTQEDPKLIDRLIERQLIRNFLATQKVEPPADDLQYQIAQAEEVIRKRGDDPKSLLTKLGYTPERLKSELGLMLAWQVYIRKTVTPKMFKEYFETHKQELDGTQLRARQIFLKRPSPADETAMSLQKEKLLGIRRDIAGNSLSFADAAKKYSEAPTKDQAGDIGLFSWQGKLPSAVSHAAFALKINEVSEPVISPFGVHLIQVTERHPGEFSLEDVRPVIFDRLSQQIWTETLEQQRATAKIERGPK